MFPSTGREPGPEKQQRERDKDIIERERERERSRERGEGGFWTRHIGEEKEESLARGRERTESERRESVTGGERERDPAILQDALWTISDSDSPSFLQKATEASHP